ncbi:MAG: Npt1/Npt2 family nucleotide transporter, partial [Candidatus Eiseniibacteriota bacterium]
MALSIPATIKRHFDLEPGEAAVLWLMGAQIATLLGAYTIVKVLRDSMFISSYGALALPYGYVAVALASLGLLALDARFARRLSGTTVADVGQYVAIAASLAAALLKSRGADWLPAVFYVWAGSQAMLLLSHFWIGALDVWDSRRARVLFPVLSGFGLLGGIAGGAFASWGASRIHTQGLLWVLFGLLVVVRGWSFLLARRVPSKPLIAQAAASAPRWKAFAESSYLRHLAAAVGLAVLISTLVDFQFKFLAQKIYPTDAELARFLGGFYAGLQALALVVQFGFAGAVLRRVGLGPSSALQPASMFVFGVGLLLVPIWPIALAMRWAQGILFQTFGKPASEIYFLALRPPERRQVKPVLDVLVERGADALAGLLLVVTLRAMGVDVRIVGVLTALAAAVWIFVIYRLHRRYVAAFRASLSAPWAEPETASQALRVPGVVRALVEAIRSGDERQATIALRFSQRVGDRRLRDAVQESL